MSDNEFMVCDDNAEQWAKTHPEEVKKNEEEHKDIIEQIKDSIKKQYLS